MSGHRAKAIALLGNDSNPTIPLGNPHFNNGFGSAILTAKAPDTNSKSTEIVSNEANDEPDSLNADVSTAMAKMVNVKAKANTENKASMTSMKQSSSDDTDDNEVISYSAYMMQNNPYQDSRRVLVNSPEIQSQSVADERLSTPFNSSGMRFSLAFDV